MFGVWVNTPKFDRIFFPSLFGGFQKYFWNSQGLSNQAGLPLPFFHTCEREPVVWGFKENIYEYNWSKYRCLCCKIDFTTQKKNTSSHSLDHVSHLIQWKFCDSTVLFSQECHLQFSFSWSEFQWRMMFALHLHWLKKKKLHLVHCLGFLKKIRFHLDLFQVWFWRRRRNMWHSFRKICDAWQTSNIGWKTFQKKGLMAVLQNLWSLCKQSIISSSGTPK